MAEAISNSIESGFLSFLESAPDAVVVIDNTGRIVIVNALAERMFDYTRQEMLGQPVELLVPDRLRGKHVVDRDGYFKDPRTRSMGAGQALLGKRKDGTEFPVEISLSPLRAVTKSQGFIISIIRDITERKEAEERIKASLREKEVLLREIHHRVKNNLQVTSSLLNLQSRYIQDPASKEMFDESQNRIRSMALVHEKLYQSSDLSRINMSEYLDALGKLLLRVFGVEPDRIRFEVKRTEVLLSIEAAVPCGLILNELISNSLKHAFANRSRGLIRASVEQRSSRNIALSVTDDGRGMPSTVNFDRSETLGLRLVHTLTQQLEGRIEVNRKHGTEITIVFPEREKVIQ